MNTAVATLPAGISNVAVAHNVGSVIDPSKINIPAQVSSQKLEEVLAQRQEQTAVADTALSFGSLGASLAVKSPTKALQEAQKKMVQDAIIKTAENNAAQTGDLSKGFVKQILKSGNEELAERVTAVTSDKVLSKVQEDLAKEAAKQAEKQAAKQLAKEAAKTTVVKGAMQAGSDAATNASPEIITHATHAGVNHGTASMISKAAPTVITAGIALGTAAWERHKASEQLIYIHAKDLQDVLGVDIKEASFDDLNKLVATNPAKYDALKQELDKEYLVTASVGAGGNIAGGAAGTVVGTALGAGVAAGVTAVTGGAGIVAAPIIVKGFAFAGGVGGSMVGGNGVTDFYKNVTGQDRETAIDAMRKLDARLQAGEQVSALDVVKVIVGNNKRFDDTVKTLNEQNKGFDDLPAEEQVKILIAKFPELYIASNELSAKINAGEIQNLASITKLNTDAVIEYGSDYALKAVAVENAANNAVPLTRISSRSVEMEKTVQGNRDISVDGASGFQAQLAAQQTNSQNPAFAGRT